MGLRGLNITEIHMFRTSPNTLVNIPATTTGLVANPGGGQANATLLPNDMNIIVTCATAADSARLPPAVPGETVFVANQGAASCNVFPSTGEQIDAAGANTAKALAAGKNAIFVCAVAGLWRSVIGA